MYRWPKSRYHWYQDWFIGIWPESHRNFSCHWSNYCFETHHGQESSERGLLISQASACFSMNFPVLFPIRFRVSWTLEAFRSPQRWKGSPWFKGWDGDGWDGDGWKGCRFCVEKVCFQDLPHRVNIIKRWMHRFFYGLQWPNSERPVRKCWILPSTRGLKAIGFLNELHGCRFLVDLGAEPACAFTLVPILLWKMFLKCRTASPELIDSCTF